jgi:hypothetical protein
MKHTGMTGRSFAAAVVLLVASGSAAVAIAHGDDALPPATQHIVTSPLVEAPGCWHPSADTPTTIAGADVQTVTVTIEATALLKVDERGRVTAAETNTGCAPRPTDHLYFVHPDGNLSEAVGFDVSELRFTGDFTQFGYHPVAVTAPSTRTCWRSCRCQAAPECRPG